MSHRQEESIKSSLPNLRNQLPQTPDTELRNLNMTKKSSKMGSIQFITILVLSNGKLAFPQMVNVGLENANLIIAGKYWYPYLHYDWDENGTAINYGGVMWDLLLFMQRARNFTFTMVSEAGDQWGLCYTVNNCTGMIGMVNRGEVDISLGIIIIFCLLRRTLQISFIQGPFSWTLTELNL